MEKYDVVIIKKYENGNFPDKDLWTPPLPFRGLKRVIKGPYGTPWVPLIFFQNFHIFTFWGPCVEP